MNSFLDFEKHLVEQDRSIYTVRGYLQDLRGFLAWLDERNPQPCQSPSEITPSDVRAYKQYLLEDQRRKASTVNRKLTAIDVWLGWAMQRGDIASNPADSVRLARQTPSAPHWLDKREQYALQRAIEKDLQIAKLRYPKRQVTRRRDASLLLLLLHTGLRLSEAVALRLSDLELSERKGSLRVQNGKGGKQRSIPLNAEARQALRDWLAVRPPVQSGYLWVVVEGENAEEGLSARAIQRVMRRYAQDAGLSELSPHTCRHTFAKNLVDNGVGLEKVASLLGHSNLNTTRLYIVPSAQDLQNAVEKLV